MQLPEVASDIWSFYLNTGLLYSIRDTAIRGGIRHLVPLPEHRAPLQHPRQCCQRWHQTSGPFTWTQRSSTASATLLPEVASDIWSIYLNTALLYSIRDTAAWGGIRHLVRHFRGPKLRYQRTTKTDRHNGNQGSGELLGYRENKNQKG